MYLWWSGLILIANLLLDLLSGKHVKVYYLMLAWIIVGYRLWLSWYAMAPQFPFWLPQWQANYPPPHLVLSIQRSTPLPCHLLAHGFRPWLLWYDHNCRLLPELPSASNLVIYPPAADVPWTDPSKLSFIRPEIGGCHLIILKWFLKCVVGVEENPWKWSSTDIQVWILHSALNFFAQIRQRSGWKISLLKIIVLRAFQILHNKKVIRWIIFLLQTKA